MKYKVGDKVKIKNYEQIRDHLFGDMQSYAGKEMTIKEVCGVINYKLEEDGGFWSWDESMFEEETPYGILKQDYAKLKADYEAKCKELEEYKNANSQVVEYKRWKPKLGETYFNIFRTNIECFIYDDDTTDKDLWRLGNCYKTRGEAEFYLEKQKATQQLKDLALELNQGWKPDWNVGSKFKYFIQIRNNEVKLDFATTGYIPIPYFKTAELAQQAVDTIGKERLLKYYFGEYEGE